VKTTLRAVGLWLWAGAFVFACNANDDNTGTTPCGLNQSCPAGYSCSATGFCIMTGASADAPLPMNDAPLVMSDAPAPSDARPPDAPLPDAPPPCTVAPCDPVATCDDSTGVAICTCPAGYEDKDGNGHTCALIDLCQGDIYPCGPNTVCTPKPTTFSCACARGYAGAPDDMFKGCSDVNECLGATAVCAAHSTCANLPGTFHCVCDPGFSAYVPGVGCSAPTCGSKGTCNDSQTCSGGTCMCLQPLCADATENDPWCDGAPVAGCIDNNECQKGACAPHGSCVNVTGSFGCQCNRGYVQVGADCVDVNECKVNNGGCSINATCTNTDGSRACACNTGFTGDGFTCTR
jgi:EGF domain/Calcium-binding EGF domain